MTTTQSHSKDETRTIVGSECGEQRTVIASDELSSVVNSDTKVSPSLKGRTVISTGAEESVLLRYTPLQPIVD
jgi:hypothetical protein